MAQVAPFRALRYNPDLVDLGKVVAPPYDVINQAQQEAFYASDPHNIIRIELNRRRPEDRAGDNCYTRAAAHFGRWQREGVLRRDQRASFFISETTYRDEEDAPKVRKGFITLLRLEDLASKVVLPHERTFTDHREDRLQLTKAVAANISPVFALYADESNQVQRVLEEHREPTPLADFLDMAGQRQVLYRVTDPRAFALVQNLMAGKRIFIADGHHRYETGLNYRDYMRSLHPDSRPQASFNYLMTYLCSMSDPGLTVLACHRVMPYLEGFDAPSFLALAEPFFEHRRIPWQGDSQDAQRLEDALEEAGRQGPSFGLAAHGEESYYVLSLKEGVMDQGPWAAKPAALKALDVEVFTSLVLEHILGLDDNTRDRVHIIKYLSNLSQVVSDVAAGNYQVAFLLNPTRVEQVRQVAQTGLIMPRKATYFFPKVITGLTLNLLSPFEKVTVSP